MADEYFNPKYRIRKGNKFLHPHLETTRISPSTGVLRNVPVRRSVPVAIRRRCDKAIEDVHECIFLQTDINLFDIGTIVSNVYVYLGKIFP
jgi:hypothetical protein